MAANSPNLTDEKPPSLTNSETENGVIKPVKVPKGRAFWMVMISIMTTLFLSAIDLTAVSTALPTIASDLQMQSTFSWVGSAYAIASTAFMPFFGSLAMIFGRRKILVTAILFFTLGSALSGAAQNGSMLIAARTIQGVGGGGIITMSEMLVTDLVPQFERGLYMGLLGLVWALASVLGPPIGGGLGGANWRWLFYLNLPLCGISLILVALFLNFKIPTTSWREKWRQLDWANFLFIASIVSILLGLTQGGNAWAWFFYRTILCLVLGGIGIMVWLYLEKNVIKEPTLPWAIVSNRTALSAQIAVFLHGVAFMMMLYYSPTWPQATKGSTPVQSGLLLGPVALTVAPFAILCGILITITQVYKIYNLIGWMLFTLGCGLMILVSSTFPVGQWVGFLIILGAGAGLLYTAPAVGVVLGSAIISSKLNADLPEAYTSMLPAGSEAAYASIPMIAGLAEPLRSEVRFVFGDALSLLFKVSTGIAGLGLLSVFLMKDMCLHMLKDERYALRDPQHPEASTPEHHHVEKDLLRSAGALPPSDAAALA